MASCLLERRRSRRRDADDDDDIALSRLLLLLLLLLCRGLSVDVRENDQSSYTVYSSQPASQHAGTACSRHRDITHRLSAPMTMNSR